VCRRETVGLYCKVVLQREKGEIALGILFHVRFAVIVVFKAELVCVCILCSLVGNT
jgi:hypothetical protein